MDDYYSTATDALTDYSRAKKLDDNSISVRLRMAAEYIKMNKYQKAVDILEEAKKIDPLNLDVYLLLVLVYTAQGNSQQANAEYEKFLNKAYSLEPENIKILEYLAQFEFQKGNIRQAKLLYKKVIQKKPKYADGYFWLGYIFENEGKPQEAIKQWQKVLEIDPNHADALNSLGYLYAEEGINLDKAEIMLKKALSLSPDNPAYLDSLGWVYFKRKEYTRAEEYLKRAISNNKDPVIYEHLGDLYIQLNDTKNAVDYYKKGLELNPESKSLKEKLSKYGEKNKEPKEESKPDKKVDN